MGYTLVWKWPPRKDIEKGIGITLFNNSEDLAIMVQKLRMQLGKLKAQKGNEKTEVLLLSRLLEIEMHNLGSNNSIELKVPVQMASVSLFASYYCLN